MKKYLIAFLGLSTLGQLRAENATSEVKIPLETYLSLIEKEKSEPITVVEEVLLKGDYRSSTFQVSIKGHAVAPWKKLPVLNQFEGHLRDCNGSAIIAFTGSQYEVLPQKSDFAVTCHLSPKNKNMTLSVLNAMYFESQVANAESNVNEDNVQSRVVSVFEKAKEDEHRAHTPIAAKGSYKLTILPDNSKFEYSFNISNPNRGTEKFDLNWINNEVVESITTNLKYQDNAGTLALMVPSGDHSVTVRGKINGNAFKPLLQSEEQYLLIQNHPLMQVLPTTNWRRIATTESAIPQDYNSARAFLIDPKESLAWSAKKLQVFAALGYTLKNANYLYYVARDGKAIVEATYTISNQGTPEISLDVPGKALYMALDNQALPLYKDDKDNLLVSLGSGQHTLTIQYEPKIAERTLASIIQNQLLKPNAVISSSNLDLRHDAAWKMVAGKFGDDFISQIPLSAILFALVIGAIYFFLLKNLYTITDKKILYTSATFLGFFTMIGSLYSFFILWTIPLLLVWRFRKNLLTFFKKMEVGKLNWKHIVAAVVLFFLFTTFFGKGVKNRLAGNVDKVFSTVDRDVGTLSENSYQAKSEVAEESDALNAPAAAPALQRALLMKGKSMAYGGSGGGRVDSANAQVTETYEGLPARIEIPNNGNNFYFNLSLMDAGKDLRMSAFFIKNYLVTLFELAALVAAVAYFYKKRKIFKEAILSAH